MNQKQLLIAIGALAVAVLVGWVVFSNKPTNGDSMMKGDKATMENSSAGDQMMDNSATIEDSGMMGGEAMMEKGSYEAYAPEKLARAEKGDVVLFFRASWCPTCRTLDADIRANLGSIPAGVTILDVNYDTETALKQKYGITYQHTMVQVDAQGNQVTKWSNSPTLAALLSKVQ